MQIRVEFLGLSRLVTGVKTKDVEMEQGATFQDLVRLLSKMYPAMIGDVIQANGETLQAPNIFNLDGKRMIQHSQMKDSLDQGDRVILMSMSAGG